MLVGASTVWKMCGVRAAGRGLYLKVKICGIASVVRETVDSEWGEGVATRTHTHTHTHTLVKSKSIEMHSSMALILTVCQLGSNHCNISVNFCVTPSESMENLPS